MHRFFLGLLTAACLSGTATVAAPDIATAIDPCDGPNPPARCDPIDPRDPANPTGSLEQAVRRPGGILVSGWARDPNRGNQAMTVVVTVGGQSTNLTASIPRGDGSVGFQALIPTTLSGTLPVCATVRNVGDGDSDTPTRCRFVSVGHDPIGNLDEVTSGLFSVRVRGWAIDPDTGDPISVHVYQDGVFVNAWTADLSRTDVDAAYPGYGSLHGFDVVLPHPTNTSHTICVYGINISTGTVNSQLGCRTWVETHGPPIAPRLNLLSTYQQVADGPYRGELYFYDQSTDETRFDVYVQGGAYSQWTSVGSLSGDIATKLRSLRLPGVLDPLTTYCFKVQAYNTNYWYHSVDQRCFTTPRLPPLAPGNLTLTTTGPTSLNVQWDDRSTDEEAFYIWYWKDRAGLIEDRSAPPRVVPASAGTGRRTITLSGLAPATRYCATIVSGYQKLKSLGPRACQSTDTLPAQPTGLTVAAGSRTTLDLRWTDNATNETGYRVDRQQGSSWVAVATLGANAVSFTHTGLVPGATSCYRVVAINAGGETASATVCGTTDTTPPDLVVVNILELDYKDPTLDAGLLHGGEPFTFGVDLCNIGGADAGKNQTQLDIWDGRSWVSSTTGSVPELPPGGCTRVHVPFANGLAANQYDAYATADSGGGVTESNEANNTFRLSFNILTP